MPASKRSNAFLDLPEELIIKILCDSELDVVVDLMSCSKVCRSLNALIKNTPCLAYLVELVLAGMKDGSPGGPCLADRVKSLRQFKDAMDSQLPYRFLSLVGPQDDPRHRTRAGGSFVFSNPDTVGYFEIHRPASFFSGVVEKVWHVDARPVINYPPVGNRPPLFMSFTADVGQDLFIVTKPGCQVHNGVPELRQSYPECHLLSISRGGAPHPLAAQVKLDALLEGMKTYGSFHDTIEIAGDLLVWTIFHIASTSHYVFNWKTGECVWHGDAIHEVFGMKCYLLDPSHLIEVSERKLYIYNMRATNHEEGHLQLELPRIKEWYSIGIESTLHRASSLSACSPAFEEDPDMTVLVLTRRARVGFQPMGQAIIIVPLSNLVDLALRMEREATQPRQEPRVLEWNEWGPENTRVVLSLQRRATVSSMIGPRVAVAVTADPTESGSPSPGIEVYTLDVRPRGRGILRRPIEEHGGPESSIWIADCYDVEEAEIFEEPIRSAAPCTVVKQLIAFRNGVPMDTMPRLVHDGLFFLEHPPED